MQKEIDQKTVYMTTTPVRRLVSRLAIPTIVSMMVTALYNVVDAAFIGRLSTEATAGIGISFAYMIFIQAVGFFFGHGSGNFISRSMGARQYDQAEVMAMVGVATPVIIGSVAAVVCTIFLTPLTTLLGATPDVVPYANDYLRYIVLVSPFMMSALTLNNQHRLQGNATFAMIGLGVGAVLNILLDPLFIFVLGWGVKGASLATAVSQIVGWVLLLMGTFRQQSIHLSLKNFKPSLHYYYEIFRGGLPSLCRQGFNCASAIMLNYAAAKWSMPGCEASTVAAFAVVSRAMMFAFSVILGFSQGFQPVSGFNYGAKLYGRVRTAYLFTVSVCTAMLFVIGVVGFIWAPQIIMVFRAEDPLLIEIGARAMRWQCAAFPLVGLSTVTNMLFQNIRMTFHSTLLSIGRQGLFFIPALLLLPLAFGLHGVEMAQAVADLVTFMLSVPYAVWISRKLHRMEQEM